MSGVLKAVATVAGVVAIVAGSIATFGIGTAAFVALAAKVAAISGAVAGLAGMGAQLLAKKPPARGSPSQILIGTDAPTPCIIGRTYAGGVLVHDVGYGPTLNDVPNPYRAMAIVYSIGLIAALEGVYTDFTPTAFAGTAASGYYSGFLYRDYRLGSPAETAMTGNWGTIPDWSSAHKLSGKAAILYSLKFDRDGKVFSGGVPQLGAVWQGVACYDPRKDSTYPGGSGSHRWADPSNRAAHDAAIATWEYTECPGLHALHYALGRYQRDTSSGTSDYQKVFGLGLPIGGLRVDQLVAFANVCDANGWKVGGVVFEPGDRWANLKDIMAAGGGEPAFTGGQLGVVYDAPGVAVDTITVDDLADDDASVTAMQSYRVALNGVVPKFRSEDHKWEYVPSEKISIPAYVAQDGEDRTEEFQWNLVQDKDQVAQLARYDLENRRELGDIVIVCKPRLRRYGPGTRLTVDIPELGLAAQLCEVRTRTIDPATLKVTFTLRSETAAKHAFALGQTGTAPPTPTLLSGADHDGVAAALDLPPGYISTSIRTAVILNSGSTIVTATDTGGGTARIDITNNEWDYPQPIANAVRVSGAITGLLNSTTYFVYFDDATLTDTAPTYHVTTNYDDARSATTDNPFRHMVGFVTTPAAGGGGSSGGGGGGGGGGGPIP